MKRQEIFDKAARHLLRQNAKALRPGCSFACAYRAADGKKCAVGALIPAKLYKPEIEDKNIIDLEVEAPKILSHIGRRNVELLRELQSLHDDHEPEQWPAKLAALGRRFKLKLSPRLKAAELAEAAA
jgi:hypothetical protein